ncbi:hypothetical protein, partial [Crossiella equi]|uniref:hypothetical protein n=1 Tax=Crossiella equi TaxID=130796 RepID=UPI001B809881
AEEFGADRAELLGHQPAEHRVSHRDQPTAGRVAPVEQLNLDSPIATVAIIAAIIGAIVINLRYLRNKRKDDD